MLSRVACSTGPRGRAVIDRIDRLIRRTAPQLPWLDEVLVWAPPEEHPAYWALVCHHNPWRFEAAPE